MVTSPYDGMLGKVGEKVGRMKPMPVIKDWQAGCVPGTYETSYEDGGASVHELVEDSAWGKVDKLIVKALDALRERGVQSPLAELQDAAFHAALGSEDRGLQLFAWRILNTRYFVEEYGRIRKVASGKEQPRDTDGLLYGGGGPVTQAELIAGALRVRGILKAKRE